MFHLRLRAGYPARRCRVVVAAILGCAITTASHAASLTLTAATDLALAQAPLLDAGRLEASAMRLDVDRAGRWPDPQLTVGIDNLATQGPGAFTAGGDEMTMRTLGISQSIPSTAARHAQKAQAEARAQVAEASVLTAEADVRRQAAEAWVALSSAREEIAVLEAEYQTLDTEVATARGRLKAGGSAADVLALRGDVLGIEGRQDEARRREVSAHATLARWLGTPADDELAPAPDYGIPPVDEPHLLARLDDLAPLAAWSPREHLADAAVDGARATTHPDWTVDARYGSRVRGLSDMVSLQVGVSLPLFSRHRQAPDLAARLAEADAVRAQHDDARREQRASVQTAWSDWTSLRDQVARQRDRVLPLVSDRVSLALALYRGGGDIQPLLQARRDELAARVEDIRLRAELGRAWVALAYLLPTEAAR